MSEDVPSYVLDSSAWLTLIGDEAGADTVQDILERARAGEATVLVSFMSLMEVGEIGKRFPLAVSLGETAR